MPLPKAASDTTACHAHGGTALQAASSVKPLPIGIPGSVDHSLVEFHGLPDVRAWTPAGSNIQSALAKANSIAVVAHADDALIMLPDQATAVGGTSGLIEILVTDGAGSVLPPGCRTQSELVALREHEEIRVAQRAGFGGVIFLRASSATVRDTGERRVTQSIAAILACTHPEILVTHNPFDRHPTHLAVLARVLDAICRVPRRAWPLRLLGGEVWGGLDFLPAEIVQAHDISAQIETIGELMRLYETQNINQHYDLGAVGRYLSHATFHSSHARNEAVAMALTIDMTALLGRPASSLPDFVVRWFDRARNDQLTRLQPAIG